MSKRIRVGSLTAAILLSAAGALLYADSATWNFTNPSDFTVSDNSAVEIAGGVARLIAKDQTDDGNDATGFGGGTFADTGWDSSNNWVELDPLGLANGNGTFTSRVIDAGGPVSWTTLTWSPERPYCKALPDNGQGESAYPNGTVSMADNVLLLHLDEAAGATQFSDSSGNGNHATCTNCPDGGDDGQIDLAIQLNGQNHALTIADDASLDLTTELTATTWVRPNGNDEKGYLFSKEDGSASGGYGLYWNGQQNRLEYRQGTDADLDSDNVFSDNNQWVHVALTIDAGGTVTFYRNGVTAGSGSRALAANNLDLVIGNRPGGSGQNSFLRGRIDEIALLGRALSASEILDFYRRGALCLKFQVRSCDDIACDTEGFIGPDGTGATDYSELDNSSLGTPALNLSGVGDNRYFQYQATFETDEVTLSPELSSVTIGPTHYDPNNPTVTPVSGIPYTSLNGFAETTGGGNAGTVRYQISHNGTDWYYRNGGGWTAAAGFGETNTANEINAWVNSFASERSPGQFHFRAFLASDGSQAVELDQIALDYTLATMSGGDSDGDSGDDAGTDAGSEGTPPSEVAPPAALIRLASPPTVVSGHAVPLDGSASTGSGLQYQWTVIAGLGSFDAENGATTHFIPPNNLAQAVTIQLTVTDSEKRQSSATVTLQVVNGGQSFGIERTERIAAWFDGTTITEESILDRNDVARLALASDDATIILPAETEEYSLVVTRRNHLAIGIPGEETEVGQVYIFEEDINLYSGDILLDASNLAPLTLVVIEAPPLATRLLVGSPGDRFGAYFWAADFNGDGSDELIIGAPGAGTDGIVYLYDQQGTLIGTILGSPDFPVSSVMAGPYFASGFDDLFFGPNNPALNKNLHWQAPVAEDELTELSFILAGRESFEKTIALDTTSVDTTVSTTASVPATDLPEQYRAIASGGDLNGDGNNDIVLTTTGGRAFIFFGPLTTASDLNEAGADVIVSGGDPDESFGHMALVGDVSGDGIGDLIVSAPDGGGDSSGLIYVIFGGRSWPTSLDINEAANVLSITGQNPNLRLGGDLLLGDRDNDGTFEIYTVDSEDTVFEINLLAASGDQGADSSGGGGNPFGGLQGGGCQLIRRQR